MTQVAPARTDDDQLPRGDVLRLPRNRFARVVGAVAVLASVVALIVVAAGGDVVKPSGGALVGEFFSAALRPRLDADFAVLTLTSAVTTLAYAVLGTALSLVVGLLGGMLCTKRFWLGSGRLAGAGWLVSRALLVVPRGVHEVVWGLLLLIVLGLDPMVAVLAIGIPFGAVTAKVFADIFDETSPRPYFALLAAGAGRGAAMVYGLLPAARADLVSYAFYRFECAIRSAAVLGLVGAGGLGFQLALSFQSLRYEEIWTLLYALAALCVAADWWSSRVRARWARRTGGAAAGRPDRALVGSAVFAVLLVCLSWWWIGLDVSVLWQGDVWHHAGELARAAWPPTAPDGGVAELAGLSVSTMIMSVIAMVIAFWCGALLAFPAADLPVVGRRRRDGFARLPRTVLRLVVRLLLLGARAIPPPVWALLLLFVLYPGVLPGALALGIYTTGVLGRLMAESAENLDGRPLRALRAQGASEVRVFCYAVVPAAAPKFVAFGLYRWEVTIRETVVVGVVGAGGLGLLLNQQRAAFDFGGVTATILAMLVLTLVVDLLSAALRRRRDTRSAPQR